MQVKKYEARSVTEAIKMIKEDLGPHAIIISAKELRKGFGLMGGNSFEVTAAVSEENLRKKQMAEQRIAASKKEQFQNLTVEKQKRYIEKSVGGLNTRRYIDIVEEDNGQHSSSSSSAQDRTVESKTDSIDIVSLKEDLSQLREMLKSMDKLQQKKTAAPKEEFPGSEFGLKKEVSELFKKLRIAGVRESAAVELLKQAQKELDPEALFRPHWTEAWCVKRIMSEILIASPFANETFHCFVGPSGHGKTSALVKFASHLIKVDRKKVAIVTADNLKVGAMDQMKTFSQILKTPFGVIKGKVDFYEISRQLAGYDTVLIDYPGMQLKTETEIEYLKSILPPKALSRIHLVLAASVREESLKQFSEKYKATGFDDFILTKLDEASGFGSLYSFQRDFNKPYHSFSVGPQIPDDFEFAMKERVVDLIFEMTKAPPKSRVAEGKREAQL